MNRALFLSILLLSIRGSLAADLVPGDVIERTAAGETKITYHVYAPKNFDAEAAPLVSKN